jgi:hypothetical protein
MIKQPIPLTPIEVRVLAQCPLHYHFMRQESNRQTDSDQDQLDQKVRDTIQKLHATGGPSRLPLADCLRSTSQHPQVQTMIKNYYRRLEKDWPQMIAGNELMQLKISLGGVQLMLRGTIDRLDKTSDGGILVILFRTKADPLPTADDLRNDHAITIYHALVAATYPLKRPVRIQEWWLLPNEQITIELSEDEYRQKLSDLREPVKSLARGEVMARPGHHCDTCSFQYHGCPVYTHSETPKNEVEDFTGPLPDGKIPPRKWIFKV